MCDTHLDEPIAPIYATFKFLYMMILGNSKIIVSLGHVICYLLKEVVFALTTPQRTLSLNKSTSTKEIKKVHRF